MLIHTVPNQQTRTLGFLMKRVLLRAVLCLLTAVAVVLLAALAACILILYPIALWIEYHPIFSVVIGLFTWAITIKFVVYLKRQRLL